MKAPKQNSNALSARDAAGLADGNGMPADARAEDDSFIRR
jgi:hypothetical protein